MYIVYLLFDGVTFYFWAQLNRWWNRFLCTSCVYHLNGVSFYPFSSVFIIHSVFLAHVFFSLYQLWYLLHRIMQRLKRYGVAGVLSYGLLNTIYYLTTFLLVWLVFLSFFHVLACILCAWKVWFSSGRMWMIFFLWMH